MNEIPQTLLLVTGALLWALIAVALLAIVFRILWDGFRALTISIWGCTICKKKTGKYLHKGVFKFFLSNWLELIGTPHRSFSLHGPGGYWLEWNDWRVYDRYPDKR